MLKHTKIVATVSDQRCDVAFVEALYKAAKRLNFEDMTPIFPNERLRMERGPKEVSMRIMDMISPIGKGDRKSVV